MTHSALVFVPPENVRDRVVAGLTLLGRARRVVESVVGDAIRVVVRDDAERSARARDADSIAGCALADGFPEGPTLVAFGEVVVDKRIVAALASESVADGEVVTAKATTGDSHVYLLGAGVRRALRDEDVRDLASFERFCSARPMRTLAPIFDTPSYAVVVSDDASASRATDALFLACIKPIDGIVSRNINRKISLRVSRLLAPTPVTPNMVTVLCMLIAFAAAGVATLGTTLALAIAGTLFQLNSVLDGVDGELARVKWQFSHFGALLDTIGDDVSNFSYFGALVYVAHVHGETTLATIGGVGLAIWAVYIAFLHWSLRGTGAGDVMVVSQTAIKQSEGFWKRTIEIASKLMRRDSFVFLAFLLALLDRATYMLPVVLVGAVSSLVFAVRETIRRFAR